MFLLSREVLPYLKKRGWLLNPRFPASSFIVIWIKWCFFRGGSIILVSSVAAFKPTVSICSILCYPLTETVVIVFFLWPRSWGLTRSRRLHWSQWTKSWRLSLHLSTSESTALHRASSKRSWVQRWVTLHTNVNTSLSWKFLTIQTDTCF